MCIVGNDVLPWYDTMICTNIIDFVAGIIKDGNQNYQKRHSVAIHPRDVAMVMTNPAGDE